jgi:hypothetical protein
LRLIACNPQPDTYSQLRKNYLRDFAAHKLRMTRLEEIVDRLNRRGVTPLILRGPALVERLYGGDGGLRPYSDVDLCTLPKEYSILEKCLTDLGFKQDCLYPQVWKSDGLAVDCHQDAMNLSRNPCYDALFPGENSQVICRSQPFPIGSGKALVPSELDEISLLAIHLVKHSFSQQIWEIDLVRCIDRHCSGGRLQLLRQAAQQSCLLHFVLYFLALKYHCLQNDFFDSLSPLQSSLKRLALTTVQRRLRGSGPLTVFLCLPPRRRWSYIKSILWPEAEVRKQIAADGNVGGTRGQFLAYRLAYTGKILAQLMWRLSTQSRNRSKAANGF